MEGILERFFPLFEREINEENQDLVLNEATGTDVSISFGRNCGNAGCSDGQLLIFRESE